MHIFIILPFIFTNVFSKKLLRLSEDATRKMSTINHFVSISVKTEFSRAQISKMIQNYGCHCFPQYSKTVSGTGMHVDELDYVCKQLGNCHKCVNIDFPGECSTDFGRYKYNVNYTTGEIDCSENPNECKRSQCECDKKFALDLGKVWDDEKYGENF